VRLQIGRAERLPCGDDSVDLVLSSMTLQHIPDVPEVLSEVNRVLRAGGRFVGIEPNNLSNEFYIDGPLEEVNAAFRRLFAARREARRPADIAIGPAVPSILEQAGFAVIDSHPYALGRLSRLSAAALLERARSVAAIASAQARLSDGRVLQECLAVIGRVAAAAAADRVGYGGQVVQVFVTIAERR
jgi:SAM-dependent methyltransferase